MQKPIAYLLVLLFSFTAYASSVPIYKSKDKNGNISYSDKKTANPNEALHLPPLSTYTSPLSADTTAPHTASFAPLPTTTTQVQKYDLIFVAPKNESIFTPEVDNIEINLAIKPSLQADDRIVLKMNGETLGELRNTTIFKLDRLDRGSYKLQAFVYSKSDTKKTKGQTEIITIHQIREMIRKAP